MSSSDSYGETDIHDQIAEQILTIGGDEEAWEEWVEFRARFHDYSYYNRLSIHSRYPMAECVKGYRDWRENGRQVEYGATKAPIIFPLTSVAEDEEEAEEHGVNVGEEYTKGFGESSVYPWGVTIPIVDRPPSEIEGKVPFVDGDPSNIPEKEMAEEAPLSEQPGYATTAKEAGTETLPEPIPLLDGEEHADILEGARRFAIREGYDVKTTKAQGLAKGSYVHGRKTITLRTGLPANQAAKTLVHELAHGLTYSNLDVEEIRGFDRAGHEVIAEGTAHMACKMLGFDTSGYSFPYLRSHLIGPEAITAEEEETREQAEEIKSVLQGHLRHIDHFSQAIRDGVLDEMGSGEQRSTEEGGPEPEARAAKESRAATGTETKASAARDRQPAVA